MRTDINGEGTFLSPANITKGGWKTSAPAIEAAARETDKALKQILVKLGV